MLIKGKCSHQVNSTAMLVMFLKIWIYVTNSAFPVHKVYKQKTFYVLKLDMVFYIRLILYYYVIFPLT